MNQLILEIVRQKWRLLGTVLFLVLLNGAFALFVSYYQLPELADQQIKWNNLRKQTAREGRVDAAVLYRQGAEDLDKLKTRIPEKREFARVIGDLVEAAASNNVEVGTINYKPVPIKSEPLLSYQLSLSASGGYAAVKSYLADLQSNPELIVVEDVSFSSKDPFMENVVMELRVTIYLRGGA